MYGALPMIRDIQFRQTRSIERPTNCCEVWINGHIVATIYPSDQYGIRVLSRHTVITRQSDIGDDVQMSTIEFRPPASR